jgi:hypothetical protein
MVEALLVVLVVSAGIFLGYSTALGIELLYTFLSGKFKK